MTRKVRGADGERAVCWPAAAAVSRDLAPDGTGEMRDTAVRAGSPLRVIHESGPDIDLPAAEQAAGQFLAALGVELDSESLRGTPGRMARGYAELFTPHPFNLTTFPNDEGYDELVLARAIPVRAFWDCPSWPVSLSTSPVARRCRNG